MGDGLNSSISVIGRQSYRTDGSVSFHASTYLQSSARRSARLYMVWGLSTKPALKRSMRCCRSWELETRSKKRRQTCRRLRIGGANYIANWMIPLSSSGYLLEGERTVYVPRSPEEDQIPRWAPSPARQFRGVVPPVPSPSKSCPPASEFEAGFQPSLVVGVRVTKGNIAVTVPKESCVDRGRIIKNSPSPFPYFWHASCDAQIIQFFVVCPAPQRFRRRYILFSPALSGLLRRLFLTWILKFEIKHDKHQFYFDRDDC